MRFNPILVDLREEVVVTRVCATTFVARVKVTFEALHMLDPSRELVFGLLRVLRLWVFFVFGLAVHGCNNSEALLPQLKKTTTVVANRQTYKTNTIATHAQACFPCRTCIGT